MGALGIMGDTATKAEHNLNKKCPYLVVGFPHLTRVSALLMSTLGKSNCAFTKIKNKYSFFVLNLQMRTVEIFAEHRIHRY